MYDFWYDYVKPKYEEKAKFYYIDTDSVSVYRKTEDFYTGIKQDVETSFDTSNYKLDRPLLKGKNKNVIGLMKDELARKLMTEQ